MRQDKFEMDEPTAAIDPIEEGILYRKIKELTQGKMGIIVTHRLGSVRIADRTIVMEKGEGMKLYHGSNTGNIKVLEPRQADHDRPYVYMTTLDVVSAFYLCNAVERPYYWFPYGFEKDSNIPIYHELYPNALREVSEGVSGYIYEVEANDSQVIPFKNIPCARLATQPIEVSSCTKIENAYDLFMEYLEQGKMLLGRFEDKSEQQLKWWYASLVDYLKQKDMINNPECSYALFIKKKFPQVWEEYKRI